MTTTTSHDSCLHWKVGSDDHWPDLPVQNPLLSTLIPRPLAWLCIDDTSVCILDGFTAACYTPPTILCAANALPESVVQKLRSHPVCTLSVVTTKDPMESIQMALTAQHQKLTQLYSLEQIGLSTIKVNAEYPVVIQSSPLHLLCHVEQFVPVDEPAEDEFLLITVETFHIAGEVLSHASQEMKQRPGVVAKIDAQLIDAMVHLAEGRVVPLRRLRSMPRPVKQESGTWISPPFVDVLPPMKGTFPDATWSYREHGGTSPLGYNATTALLMPRPIGWISTYKKDTKQPHLAPYSFFTDVSRGPIPYVAFSAYCGRSKKDAHRNAEETGFFVCNMPTEELAIAMNLSAAELSRDESEFELAHLVADSATWVDAPIVPQAPIRYECQYVKTVVEHSFAIVIGRVIGISINRSVIAGGSVNISLIRPLTRLGLLAQDHKFYGATANCELLKPTTRTKSQSDVRNGASHQAKSFSKLSRASTLYHSVSSMARVDYRLRRVSIRNTQQLNGISLAMTTSSSLPIFDVYPFISHTDFPTRQSKIVHFCRHAQAYHNINHTYRNIQNLDARLTTAGMVQCQSLAGRISKAEVNREPYLHHLRENVELIVTSPLTRCIQTTLHSFEPVLNRKGGKPPPPVLAHDLIRETVNYICDRRRTRSEIQRDFTCPTTQRPLVDLSHVATEHDDIWERYEKRLGNDESYTMHRESAELHVVADRARDFLTWLAQRPEKHVLVCSHAAFLRCLWNYGTPSYDLAQFPKQMIDERPNPNEFIPVIRYQGDAMLPAYMGKDFENCELRTVVVAFRDSSDT